MWVDDAIEIASDYSFQNDCVNHTVRFLLYLVRSKPQYNQVDKCSMVLHSARRMILRFDMRKMRISPYQKLSESSKFNDQEKIISIFEEKSIKNRNVNTKWCNTSNVRTSCILRKHLSPPPLSPARQTISQSFVLNLQSIVVII